MQKRGLACFDHLVASSRVPNLSPPPTPPHRDVAAGRFARAIRWAIALSQLLSGTCRLAAARPSCPQAASIGPTIASSPSRASEHLSSDPAISARFDDPVMHAAFRTRPLGQIVGTICRDLGVTPSHELWPADLVAITLTAAEWTASLDGPVHQSVRAAADRQTPRQIPLPHPPAPPNPDPRATPHQRAP